MLERPVQAGAGAWEAVGNTPMVRLGRMVPAASAGVYTKLEFLNPSGSVKDRAAVAVIADAERRGVLKPGGVIVEATSGNMGVALAMVGAAKGYQVTIVMPQDAPEEQKRRLAAYGAQVVLSASAQGMEGAVRQARELAQENTGAFLVDQFANPAGARAHREGTGAEVLAALRERGIDAFVAGVGSGATLTGVAEALKAAGLKTAIVAVEPALSPVLSQGRPGQHRIVGIGPPFVPQVFRKELVDEVIGVTDEEAYATAASLARQEGLYVGPSSGANVAAALTIAARLGAGKAVVTLLPDGGERYVRSVV